MGCAEINKITSTIKTNFKRKEEDKFKYPQNQKDYQDKHQIALNCLSSTEFYSELEKYSDISSYISKSNEINSLSNRYFQFVRNKGINSEGDFQTIVREKICESIIDKNFLIKSIDIFKTSKELFKKLIQESPLNKETEDSYYDSFKSMHYEFKDDMRGIVYNLTKEFKRLNFDQFLAIHNVIKYNENCSPQILTIKLNQRYFDNDEESEDLSKCIEKMEDLKILALIICPEDQSGEIVKKFGFDVSYFKVLYKLLNAVKKNRNIKGLIFHSLVDYEIVLAPEICNLILEKLQSETLKAIHLGGFNINESFFEKLMFHVGSTRSLSILSVYGDNIFRLIILKGLADLSRNRSLSILSFSGVEIGVNEKKGYENFNKALKEKNDKIKTIITSNDFIDLNFKTIPKK